MTRRCLLVLLVALVCSCSSTSESNGANAVPDASTSPADGGLDGGGKDDAGPPDAATGDVASDSATSSDVRDVSLPDFGPIGGDRPADVVIPEDYDPNGSYPVVVLLHGYSVNSTAQDFYFRTSTLVDEYDFLLVLPDGTEDEVGNRFWNATDACCDFYDTGVDDSSYLRGVVDEVLEQYAADSERVYFMGHSNGGYMSYRMACDHDDRVAAIASLAGSTFLDEDACQATDPVGVLQAHGTTDSSVAYPGVPGSYPGAEEIAERWGTRNGCSGPTSGGTVDFSSRIAGEETDIDQWSECDGDVAVELWTMNGVGHIPAIDADFTRSILDFLFAQRL